jgi:transposase
MDIEQSYEARTRDSSEGGVLVRVERRRRWSDEAKLTILKETTEPGALVSVVARRHGIGTGQLYTWRRQLLQGAMAGFVPVELAKSAPPTESGETGRIEIRGRGGLTVSVGGLVDRAALKLVLDVVAELGR